MAGGTKKKKIKPVSNPARGFATTSLQSKSKTTLDSPKDADGSEASNSATPKPVPASHPPEIAINGKPDASATRGLHELNPEELEAQLEASELQQFVEQNAAKVRKESSRHASRLETDKRLLRGQADFFVQDWLPEELMHQIFEFTLAEYDAEQSNSKSPVGDDLLAKVWTLRCCLLDLGVPLDRVNDVLGWLVSHPPAQAGGALWGLADALDWLSLHCTPADLNDYDYQKTKADSSEEESHEDVSPQDVQPKTATKAHQSAIDARSGQNQEPVSDLEDDADPAELFAIYLRTKARLFQIEPSSVDLSRTKRGRNTATQSPQTATGKKLHQKLQKIESDLLFDLPQAEAHWAQKKIELTREAAERRRLQLPDGSSEASQSNVKSGRSPTEVSDEAEKLGQELLRESEDDDEILGGMFDVLPGVHQSNDTSNENGSANLMVRDFGRLIGMSPKRVLEEACKARDSGVKLSYMLVSPTTYASRHSLTINWSKDQGVLDTSYMTSVQVKSRSRTTVFTAIKEATPDAAQSEAYIATMALFAVFSGSPKEEKAHMRLPYTFRDLWDELVLVKEEHSGAADRDTVKQLRQLIERHNRQVFSDDEDEVVFKAGSRQRSTVASSVTTPAEPPSAQEQLSQELQDLWSRKVATSQYQKMMTGRKNLPIFHYKREILEAVTRSQVLVLVSETGSGKSTQLPAYILEHELSHGRKCKVYCTEPRRISAISLAQRVSQELGEHKNAVGTMHSLVGFAIRLESQTSAATRLVYATTGIVLRMLENVNGLSDITHLVIDEVHERSIDTDFLLIILRSLLLKKPDLKVILMSATVDAQRFSNYLNGAPIINVPGRTFPVQAAFLEDAIELTGHTNEDASQAAVDEDADGVEQDEDSTAKGGQLTGYSKRTLNTIANYDEYRIDYSLIVKLIQRVAFHADYQRYSSATLVFLPGIGEIKRLHEILISQPAFRKGWMVHALHSTFSSEDQQAAFEVPPKGVRKIVLATNIAETGITIPDVTCVIDTGKHKEMRFDEKRQMSRLILSFIAKANAKQRRGRAGRVQEGLCFHLFTKYRHDELMAENQTPEMLRLSLQDLVMRVKICKLGGIENALSQALDPPLIRNIRRAIDALIEVDALTPNEELTPLGQQLARLPLDAQLGKLILLGSQFGCLDATLTVAATLTSKTPFLNPMHAKKQADTVRLGYKRADSDLLTVYNAYCTWRKVCTTAGMSEYQFCDKNFLSAQNLANIEDLKSQLLTSLVDAGFVTLGPEEKAALARVRSGSRQRNFIVLPDKYHRTDDDDAVVQSVVAWSFYPKIVKQEGKGWRNIANNQTLALHPASVNKMSLSSDVKLLSFYSIMQSNSRFTNAQETTATPEMALVLLAGDAVFHMYAGVIVIDGNRLRYKVKDWRTMIALKMLRRKMKEILARLYRLPGKELTGKHAMWMELLMKMFEKQRKA